jgi:hypothetical protein
MFPSLKDPEHANVRLKNVGRQVYLCVTQDSAGTPVLGTKTLNENVDPDGKYVVRAPLVVFCGYVEWAANFVKNELSRICFKPKLIY